MVRGVWSPRGVWCVWCVCGVCGVCGVFVAIVTPVDGNANLNGDLRNVNPGAKTRRFERRGLSGSRQVTRINSRVQNDAFLIYPNSFGVCVVCVVRVVLDLT